MEELFVESSRKKDRFSTKNGTLTNEDLWELNFTSLDTVAKALNKELKESEDESFIKPKTAVNKTTARKLEIVKYIIAVKMAEEEAKKTAAEKKAKKEFLSNLIAEKQVEGLKGKSIEELQKELESI